MNNALLRRRIIAIGVPAGLETVAATLVFTLNTGIVARLGDDAVAGVGMASAVTLMLFLLLAASGSGGMIVAAQHFGAGNREALARTVGVVLVLDLLLNLAVCLGLTPWTEETLRLLGLGGRAVEMGNDYLYPMLFQVPIMAAGRGASEMMRSVGRTTTPFIVNSVAGALNVLLTWLFVFGAGPVPAMGVAGAAVSTLIAQTLGAGVLIGLLLAGRTPIPLRFRHLWSPAWGELPLVLKLGLPQMMSRGLWGVGSVAYDMMFARVGMDVFAAVRVVWSVDTPMCLIAVGLETAALAVVGQALGGRDMELARRGGRQVMLLTVLLSLVMIVLYFLLVPFFPDLYPALSASTMDYVRMAAVVMALSMTVRMLNVVMLNGVIRSGGDTTFLMVGNMITVFLFGLPAALILAFWFDLGFWGVMGGKMVEEVSRVAIAMWRWRGAAWMRTLVPVGA